MKSYVAQCITQLSLQFNDPKKLSDESFLEFVKRFEDLTSLNIYWIDYNQANFLTQTQKKKLKSFMVSVEISSDGIFQNSYKFLQDILQLTSLQNFKLEIYTGQMSPVLNKDLRSLKDLKSLHLR